MGFLTKPRFKDLTMENKAVKVKIGLFKYNKRFEEAQIWLDRQVMSDMSPYVPYRTGAFLSRIKAENALMEGTGQVKAAVPPQGRYLYNGVSRFSGRALHYTNPITTPRWFETVKSIYYPSWENGVREIIRRK